MTLVIPAGIQAQLDAGASTLCRAWVVTRRDAAIFGWTDHDKPLTVAGVTCAPTSGMNATDAEETLGLATSNAEATGALDAAGFTAAAIEAGLWDGATVQPFWVDWSNPADYVVEPAQTIGTLRRTEAGFTCELLGPGDAAQVARGRVYGRHCDAAFGDARCGIDATGATYRGTGTVVAAIATGVITASGLGSYADRFFGYGVLEWTSGANDGAVFSVRAHRSTSPARIELWGAPANTPEVGDTFTITAGCDKTFAQCKRYSNADNFRGFPHIPGDATVARTADKTEPKDGSGRNVGRD